MRRRSKGWTEEEYQPSERRIELRLDALLSTSLADEAGQRDRHLSAANLLNEAWRTLPAYFVRALDAPLADVQQFTGLTLRHFAVWRKVRALPRRIVASFDATIARWLSLKWRRCRLSEMT